MFQILSSFLLVVSLVLGAGGVTTYATQASLPDQPLYFLKLWSEDARLKMTGEEQNWQVALKFAEQRAAEIRQMAENGQIPTEALQTRLRFKVEQAIQLAADRPDEMAVPALEQIRLRLQTQEQAFAQMQEGLPPLVDAALLRARLTLQERLGWVESGIQEPNGLRQQFHLRLLAPTTPPSGQEPGGNGQSGSNECLNCTPQGEQNGSNPWTTGTPTPGSGYGEGQGSNPWTTGTPTPGSGYGPGPGPDASTTCTPAAYNWDGTRPTEKPNQPSGGSGSQPDPANPGSGQGSQEGSGQPQEPPKGGGKP